jgi:dihydrolipoamide dehydrogenase
VTHIEGRGRLAGKGKVEVTGKDGKKQTVSGEARDRRDRLAPARPALPEDRPRPRLGLDRRDDGEGPRPKTLAVVGAGAIGCEFADVYAAFGTKVTIIEALDRVLPLEDRDCSAVVEKSYRKRGMEISPARSWRRRRSARTG